MTKTYAQLTREIQALQASAEKLRATEVKAAIAKLNESIAEYGLTADDLHFPGSASASARRQTASTSASPRTGASTDAKYSDGQGNTWGGRGPRPAWLRNAISGGRSLESFETAASSSSSRTAGRPAKEPGALSKVKLPALYGHPKTGQTWSGRGPKPAWLKQGLKKRGSSIDDFLISAHASTPAEAPAPAPAQPQGSHGRAKPAAVKPPVAARKSLAQKIGSSSKASPSSAPKASPAASTGKNQAIAAPATSSTTPPAPAKKTAAKPVVKPAAKAPVKAPVKAPAKQVVKPAAKKASAPRKNLPSSMAPPADAAPAPSTVPAAAPMPAAQSDSVEGRGDVAGT
ncbi:MAG TPA: H-NS family nucleoid-associated regulatory protein [Variovorax sp.]|nr:H-NS family nucleoid-associated regulatory protein [Variovorax sp.]